MAFQKQGVPACVQCHPSPVDGPVCLQLESPQSHGGEARGLPDNVLLSGLREFCTSYYSSHPDVDYFMFGHVHVLSREKVADGCEMIVLGEWIRTCSYAVLNDDGLELRIWKQNPDNFR